VIAVANPLTVAVFCVGLVLQIWRAKVEEQSLAAAFPEYRAYAARTPMLIPLAMLPQAWARNRATGAQHPVTGLTDPRPLDS
jgi:hypothetical protein